jgi:uncharacterized protein YbjT (DUF2867 family)
MRIAITGGTGFVGSHLADALIDAGHEVVPASRRTNADVSDRPALAAAFAGAAAVVHCAGINREIGDQSYEMVHVEGTAAVIDAARRAGVQRLVVLSFLRARPDGPSPYHRSKWQAEELARQSGLTYTIVKAGVIYGRGDHLLDHISKAIQTFPIFGLVGLGERWLRPVAVADVGRLLAAAALGDPRLADRTIAAVGPEEISLGEAATRIAGVVGRRTVVAPLPVAIHRLLAVGFEAAMRVPLVSRAQVEILAEGVVEPLPFADAPPADLAPSTPFTADIIRAGLPQPGGFGRRDCRCLSRA